MISRKLQIRKSQLFKRNIKQYLADSILIYTLFAGFFTYNFDISESAFYFSDVLNVLLLILSIKGITRIALFQPIKKFIWCIITLTIVGVISSFLQGANILLILWSIRNWGRAVSFFLVCCYVIDKEQAEGIIRLCMNVFHINTIVILIQYLFFRENYTVDSLNGLLGRGTSGLNISFLMIVFCIYLSGYFTKKIGLNKLVFCTLELNTIAVLAELKGIILFEIIFVTFYIVLCSSVKNKDLVRYVVLGVGIFVVAIIAGRFLVELYPQFRDFMNTSSIVKAATSKYGYGNSGYIDRLNFYEVINTRLFYDNKWKRVFGIGLGNAEYSSVSLFTSDFYKQYGTVFRYLNFSTSMIYIEIGIVGLMLFLSSYLILFMYLWNIVRDNKDKIPPYYELLGVGIVMTTILLFVYNNMQRTDVSFILSFFLAIPFAVRYNSSR